MTYVPRTYRSSPVVAGGALHKVRRFTAGHTPALAQQINAAGGFDAWFDRQLADGYDDDWYTRTAGWWTSNTATPAQVAARDKDGTEPFWRADANYQCWTVVRRIGSQRQVRETMADFFEHHLHVPARGEVGPFRASYGTMIRSLALGRFEDMLQAAIVHPAMSVYLTNANSTKSAPNENLGRELLELHTVGRGNYTEDDVKASARLLTGFRVGLWTDWATSYDPTKHATGAVTVMGFTHPNSDPDGRAALTAYLSYLARHPATARRLATKLVRRFVSDDPAPALVERLAGVYLDNQTAIAPVLRALVSTPELTRAPGVKVRTPAEDVAATYRALGAVLAAPGSGTDESGANALMWQAESIGLAPLSWQRPDGRPDTADAWSSTSRFLSSLDLHYTMAGGWWPTLNTTYRAPAAWLPAPSLRFDELVDHLARVMHGRGSSGLLLQVACEAAGCVPEETITASHRIVRWEWARLLTVLLDSPIHLTR